METTRRARVAWQCRRGMKELDVLLEDFLEHQYDLLGLGERQAFEILLGYPDPLLLEYLMGRMMPVDKGIADVVIKIRRTSGN